MTPKESITPLTHARLRELLDYDELTGHFYSMSRRAGIPFGRPRGSLTNFGYIIIRLDGIAYLAHRLAWFWMEGVWPQHEVDHHDGIRSRNVWKNLRDATTKQNRENRARQAKNTSGFRGVSWSAPRQRWLAQIKHHGKQRNLGRYPALIDAVAARLAAERTLFTHHREAT